MGIAFERKEAKAGIGTAMRRGSVLVDVSTGRSCRARVWDLGVQEEHCGSGAELGRERSTPLCAH